MNEDNQYIELLQAVRRLSDIEAIRRLIVRYAYFVDAGFEGAIYDIEEWMGIFTEDAVWDTGALAGRIEGREAIGDHVRGMFTGRLSLHILGEPMIDIDQDKATLRCHVTGLVSTDDQSKAVVIHAIYQSDVVRTADGWRFAYFHAIPCALSQLVIGPNGPLSLSTGLT